MVGDALLPSPQGRDRTFPDLLELFAAVMLGQLTPDDAASRMATDARRSAREAITSARAPVGSQETLALRSIYDQVRALGPVTAPEATRKNAVLGRTRAAQAMDALLHLRNRQRAALVMHDVGGLVPAVVASVLGLTTPRAHDVVDAARAAVLKRLPRPMNVRHVLRDAARRLISGEAFEPEVVVRAHASAPRSPCVVETLIAPAPRPLAEPTTGLLTDGLLRALETAPPDIHLMSAPRRDVQVTHEPLRAPARRKAHPWIAAACALLAAMVFLPAAARSPQSARSPQVAPAPVAPNIRVGTTTRVAMVALPVPSVTVGRNDSLWAIARRTTGDAERWPEIWRLNANDRMSDGTRFTDPDLIHPGWRLRLPSPGA